MGLAGYIKTRWNDVRMICANDMPLPVGFSLSLVRIFLREAISYAIASCPSVLYIPYS